MEPVVLEASLAPRLRFVPFVDMQPASRGACDREEEKEVSQPGSAKAPESTPTVLGTARG